MHLPSELYRPSAGIAAPPAAQPGYRGGPLLDSIKVFTIFWGQVWHTSPNSDLANQINQFFTFVVSSALVDQLAEYSVPGQPIGHGSFIGTVTIIQPTLSHSVTDAAMNTASYDQFATGSYKLCYFFKRKCNIRRMLQDAETENFVKIVVWKR